jgi:thiol-disulfide isomerase/thioredoxin
VLRLAIAMFAILLLGLHFSIKKQQDPAQVEQFADEMRASQRWPGRVAPDFELETIDGGRYHLSESIGKRVILLNFFATWCEPCRQEIPELLRFGQSLGGEPFSIVFVDGGEEPGPVRKLVEDMHLTPPIGIDHARRIQKLYGVSSYPTNVLIGADGRVLLYEAESIRNADVTLRPLVTAQIAAIRAGKGITPEAYAAAAAGESYREVLPRPERRGTTLNGRPLEIAKKMDCLCGCTKKVADCTCNNASKVKAELAKADLGSKTDADVMREMGAKFCMESM